jgi:hypothetical protein
MENQILELVESNDFIKALENSEVRKSNFIIYLN